MQPRQWLSRRLEAMRTSASRGATLVEYALVLSLFVVVSLGAMDFLSDSADREIDNQVDCVSERPPPPECQLVAVTTSTTLDPTPTTATTAPPVEEKAPVLIERGRTFSNPGDPWWVATQVELTLESNDDVPIISPLPGVTVRARVRLVEPGSVSPPYALLPQEFFISCTTDAAGQCELRFDVPFDDVDRLHFTYTAVDSSPPGQLPSPDNFIAVRPT